MLAKTLQEAGHEVHMFCFQANPDKCYPEIFETLNVSTLPADWSPPRQTYFLRPFGSRSRHHRRAEQAQALAAQVTTAGMDVVNLHDLYTFEVAAFLPEELPTVWMLNDVFDPSRIHREVSQSGGLVSAVRPRLSPRNRLKVLRARALRRINEIVVLDRRNRERVAKAFAVEAHIVRSGVSVPDSLPGRQPPSNDETVRLLSIGIMYPHRRFEDLISAVSLIKERGREVKLKLVGKSDFSPDYRAKLDNLVHEHGLRSNVTFIETLSEAQLDEEYRDAHIFVFPHAPQTWGLSPFESMAKGTPVVLTTGCGASEVLTDGEDALVVAPYEPHAIAQAVERLLDDPTLWSRIRTRAFDFLRTSLSWQRYAARMEEIFRACMQPIDA